MNPVSRDNFGLLIAYLIPGFTALWGISPFSPTIQAWLGNSSTDAPSLGGFLYVTVGAITFGLLIGILRWVTVDTVHHWSGIQQPNWDFSKLRESVAAYDVLNEIHYKYYQFYSGMLIATPIAYVGHRIDQGTTTLPLVWSELGLFTLEAILWMGSRDTLNLCGRPHKRNYVNKSVMWCCSFSLRLRCARLF